MIKDPASKTKLKPSKPHALRGNLDTSLPSTALAFRTAAKAYTKKATRTKEEALKTLQKEGFLTKQGALTRRYAAKG